MRLVIDFIEGCCDGLKKLLDALKNFIDRIENNFIELLEDFRLPQAFA